MRWFLIILLCFSMPAVEAGKRSRSVSTRSSNTPISGWQKMPGWNWSEIRAAVFGKCNLGNRCSMCNGIRAWYSVPGRKSSVVRIGSRQQARPGISAGKVQLFSEALSPLAVQPSRPDSPSVAAAEGACDSEIMDDAIDLLECWRLNQVCLCFGTGNGTDCIKAVQAGAVKAYGLEWDGDLVSKAKANVAVAVQRGEIPAGSVVIIPGDFMRVNVSDLDATVGYAYLSSSTLDRLYKAGKFNRLDRLVTPGHWVDGMPQRKIGGCFLFDRSDTKATYYIPPPQNGQESHKGTENSSGSREVFGSDTSSVSGTRPSILRLFFTSPGCPPCAVMKPRVARLGVEVRTIDVSRNPEIARSYGVYSYPQFIRHDTDQGKMWRKSGLMSESDLRKHFR